MITVVIWWAALFFIGAGFLPLSNRIFRGSADKGWFFSKMLGFFLSMWTLWVLCVFLRLPFTRGTALLVTLFLIAVNYAVYACFFGRESPAGDEGCSGAFLKELFPQSDEARKVVLIEELLFLGIMLFALYVIGFRPEAKGTEKFMDYAFIAAMNRSTELPFPDPWLGGHVINYYYGGQYAAAFLMKLTGCTPGLAYNAMRALVTAMSFVLPFSLVYQMMRDRIGSEVPKRVSHYPYEAGFLAGTAVALSGNGHYLLYGFILRVKALITGEAYDYWFPDSTRYIGFNPDVPDKTIHEFPAYSTILGDLHAHYVNLIFVLLLLGILYSWARNHGVESGFGAGRDADRRTKLREMLHMALCPEVLLMGILTGVFRWTNAADFAIYYVVCGSVLFFTDLMLYRDELRRFALTLFLQAVVIFAAGALAALPFTAYFVEFTQGIAFTNRHSMLYQLAVLWGLPVAVLAGFAVRLIREKNRMMKAPDLTALLFGLCAAGLVLLPELVYVKDIYSADHQRGNTMFKLTYQAFILFAVMMGYVLVRAFYVRKKEERLGRLAATAALFLLVLTAGYIFEGGEAWFGNILHPSRRLSSDASYFLENEYASDVKAVEWLNSSIEGTPIIVEADGESYSDSCRISVATGLPTVAGWYVHEWLWRNDFQTMSIRRADVYSIYSEQNWDFVWSLLDEYDVTYIYVGKLEREKYGELDEEFLKSLGEVVYEDETGTFIVKVR